MIAGISSLLVPSLFCRQQKRQVFAAINRQPSQIPQSRRIPDLASIRIPAMQHRPRPYGYQKAAAWMTKM